MEVESAASSHHHTKSNSHNKRTVSHTAAHFTKSSTITFLKYFAFNYLPPEENAIAGICLSVCLLARLLKNAWTDLDEMLRVDRCRNYKNMEELINF